MRKDFRTYTHAMPLAERTTVLFNELGFANTTDEKLAMAKAAQRAAGAIARRQNALKVAWPGDYDTHVFAITPEQVIEHLTPKPAIAVGDLVKCIVRWGGSYTNSPAVGSIGVVRKVRRGGGDLEYGVEWVGFTTGNDLDGILPTERRNKGWYVGAKNITKA